MKIINDCSTSGKIGLYARLVDILSKFEVDRAVFFGLLAKAWLMLATPVSILLIAYLFSPELQGYYYTFGSLLFLQVFVEMGFGMIITIFASHEWSMLGLDKSGRIIGDYDALTRLIGLARIAIKWYLIGGIALSLGLGVGGYIFFSSSSTGSVNWAMPWFALCLLTGITLCLLPVWALLEGCNQVAGVNFYRFLQGLAANLALWLAIISGAELWAAVVYSAAGIICAVVFLRIYYWQFLKTLFSPISGRQQISWVKEIWPVQRRFAISWASGYFVLSFFTPVLFYYHGAEIAGQMGMTWTLAAAVNTIASVWAFSKTPYFGMLIAREEYEELNRIFWRITKVTIIAALLGAVLIWTLIDMLYVLKHPLSLRMLPPLPSALFIAAMVVITVSTPMSIYLRAHKKDPLMLLTVINGILVVLSNLILGKYFSATGMAVGYFAVNVAILPFIVFIWHRSRVEWHERV